MILRELITRFGFEVSKKDVNKYESTVKGLTRRALKFAAIFGGAFSLKGLINAGLSAEQAEFNLRRLAGVDFSKFTGAIANIRKEINAINQGAGDLFTDKNAFIAASDFVEEFGSGADALKTFNKLLSFSARISAVTGGNVNKMMASLQQGITGGNFDFLKKLPEFEQVSVNTINELNKIFDPKEFGGQIGIDQKIFKLLKIIDSVQNRQDQTIKQIPDTLLKSRLAAKSFENTVDKAGKSFNKVLVPAAGFVEKEIRGVSSYIDDVDKNGFSRTFLKAIFSDAAFEKITGENKKIVTPISQGKDLSRGTINRSPSIKVTNHIKVVTDDPRKAGAIVIQKFNDEVRKARSQINKTEDRGDR